MKKNNIFNYLSVFIISVVLLVGLSPLSSMAFDKTHQNSIGMAFVLIPAGTFIMGSPESEKVYDEEWEEIQHKVTLTRPFYMQTTEVTVAQWQSLMGKKLFGRRRGPKDLPVTKVSWKDCQKFIKRLNARGEGVYRLPTEAEWEYACRAGSKTAYTWGDEINCSQAMYANKPGKADSCKLYVETLKLPHKKPAPVKTYAPNRWGLFDMHGNVWEWCQDLFGKYQKGHVRDPQGAQKGNRYVKRGGSWSSYGHGCRSANRALEHRSSRMPNTGFRLVREVN